METESLNTGLEALNLDTQNEGPHVPETPQLTDEQAKSIVVENAPKAYGGYADVYKGYWTSPWTGKDETVAVKILRFSGNTKGTEDERLALDVIAKRLGREVTIWQRLDHPRITPLLGYTRTARMITDSERPSIISPWRAFGNLSKYIKEHGEVNRVSLLIQAAEAVNCLHTFKPQAIVHLDLKPENFLVTDAGEVQLCDFGVSRVMQDTPSGFTTGPGAGTMPYQAFEYLDKNERTTAVDVYAFGGVMLKVLSGNPPFVKVPEGRLVIDISQGKKPNRKSYQIDLPSSAVEALWTLMNKCWSFKPTDRPSMAIVIKAIATQLNA
ncbi:hypothetical protein FRB90_011217 [Tulasnella sp. 427]|nr:hypothetical protein FRB90_011217 [Tulasnella sp. 427]